MFSRLLHIVVVVGAYWTVAITMVFVNKHLMTDSEISSDVSVFLVWLQNIIAVMLIFISNLINSIFFHGHWHGPSLDVKALLLPDMVLASMTFTGTLVFNNLMLKYISVAFYQVARSFTLIFVIICSSVLLQEAITSRIIFSCVLIVTGFYVSVDQEMLSQGMHPAGILYGILASVFAAVCGVFFKRIQVKQKTNSLQLALNNGIISSLALTPLVISTGQLSSFCASNAVWSVKVWPLIFLSGTISLAMGWISALQITVTSPLTHNISINAKSVFQTLLAVLWSGESRAWMWWIGNVFVMAGITIYIVNKFYSTKKSRNMDMEITVPEMNKLDVPQTALRYTDSKNSFSKINC